MSLAPSSCQSFVKDQLDRPTRDISSRITLNNCGSSSICQPRRKSPARVIRGSFASGSQSSTPVQDACPRIRSGQPFAELPEPASAPLGARLRARPPRHPLAPSRTPASSPQQGQACALELRAQPGGDVHRGARPRAPTRSSWIDVTRMTGWSAKAGPAGRRPARSLSRTGEPKRGSLPCYRTP